MCISILVILLQIFLFSSYIIDNPQLISRRATTLQNHLWTKGGSNSLLPNNLIPGWTHLEMAQNKVATCAVWGEVDDGAILQPVSFMENVFILSFMLGTHIIQSFYDS